MLSFLCEYYILEYLHPYKSSQSMPKTFPESTQSFRGKMRSFFSEQRLMKQALAVSALLLRIVPKRTNRENTSTISIKCQPVPSPCTKFH